MVKQETITTTYDPQVDMPDRYPAYWRTLPANWQALDTYRINQLFPLKDDSGRLVHARKKLLVPGTRTGGKSFYHDIKEAHATLGQWLEENKDHA